MKRPNLFKSWPCYELIISALEKLREEFKADNESLAQSEAISILSLCDDLPDDDMRQRSRLPLHHACRKSSSERIIRTLLRVYPRAAQIKDDQDKLPIHYACQNGTSPSVVNVLLTTYPESINVKNGFGYTPLAEARALENPKMDPIIHVLEKFKVEQDKIKLDSGDTVAWLRR